MRLRRVIILFIVCILCLTGCVKKTTKPGNDVNDPTDNQVVDNTENTEKNNNENNETVDNNDNTGEDEQNGQTDTPVEVSDELEIPIDDDEESFGE